MKQGGSVARTVQFAGLTLLVLAGWMVQHPYAGLAHDSVIYTLLALARLHPDTLASDVYLRFSSQGEYTLFSPIFATAIRVLDLDPAAAWLTFASQLAFFACAGVLARRLTSARLALLAVGLLAVLSTDYGSSEVFHAAENFLTPRLSAAALVFAALAASLSSRYIITGVCMLAAIALHPIMASAGVAMLFSLHVALPRPRLALVVTLALLLVSAPLVWLNPAGLFDRFDPAWLKIVVGNSSFLFMSHWLVRDWFRAAVPLAVLVVGWVAGSNQTVRRVSGAALLMAIASAALTYLYCDLLQVVLVTRMQPWRWLWLANTLAVLLLPVVIHDCWKGNAASRASALLLLCAWILRDDPGFRPIVLLAIAGASVAHLIRDPSRARLILVGAVALLAAAVGEYLLEHSSFVGFNDPGSDSGITGVLQLLRERTRDGLVYAAVLAFAWYVASRLTSVRSTAVLVVVGLLVCLTLCPVAWSSWHASFYTRTTQTAFSQWGRQIPLHSEVIWPFTPVGAWYFLDRPSYFSLYQIPGDVFSRQKAIEIHRRGSVVAAALAASTPASPGTSASHHGLGITGIPINADWVDLRGLRILCTDPALGFVVAWRRIAETPFAPVIPHPDMPRQSLHLYRCKDP